MSLPTRAIVIAALLVPVAARAEVRIDYVFTNETRTPDRPTVTGGHRVASTIDGRAFRNASAASHAVEVSSDDGLTTTFEGSTAAAQTPLSTRAAGLAPIAAWRTDETLVIGDSAPGPVLFGLPTRHYSVDYDYLIASRVLLHAREKVPAHAHFVFTVADIGVSSAALRVALSRGHGHALAQRAEAFTGLPLMIDGTVETRFETAHLHVQATALER